MKTTAQFLDAVKAKLSLPSDYALAPVLGITKQSVSRLRNGKDFLGDETAEKVAQLLGEQPAYVIACAHAERTKSDSQRRIWEAIADKFGGLAAGVVFAVGAVAPAPSAQAAPQAQAEASAPAVGIMSTVRHRPGVRDDPRRAVRTGKFRPKDESDGACIRCVSSTTSRPR